jgi:hypothetical protein
VFTYKDTAILYKSKKVGKISSGLLDVFDVMKNTIFFEGRDLA